MLLLAYNTPNLILIAQLIPIDITPKVCKSLWGQNYNYMNCSLLEKILAWSSVLQAGISWRNNSFDSQRYYLKHIVHSMKLDEIKCPSNTE